MGLFYLLSALVVGAAAVRRVPFPIYRFEAFAAAIVLGLFSWIWVAFVVSLVLPYDVGLPIVVVGAAAVSVWLWRGGKTPEWRPLEGGRTAWIVWGVATLITGILLARMFDTHSLVKDSEGIWSAGASWADYGVHASYVTHIAAMSHLPSDLPIAAGEKITYPFLIDLLSSFFVQGGMSLHAAFFWPGLLLVLSICQLIIAVGLRLFGRISVGVGGLGLALTIGSASGAWQAWHDWRHSGQGFFSFLGKLPGDYSEVNDKNAHVTNFVVDALLPQRAILFGFGVGLIVLILLHQAREKNEKRLLWPAAVLVGLLPMAHPHSFLIMVAFFFVLAAEAAWKSKKLPKDWLLPIIAFLVIALPQLIWQQTANQNGSGGRFRFAWMWQHGTSLLGYWWGNFGLMGIAFLAIPVLLFLRKKELLIWFVPPFLVLIVTQIYAFQPFEYDNLKLLYWVYLFAGFFVAYGVSELIRKHKAWLVLVVPLGLLVVTPGALAIKREFQLHDQFATPDDIALAKWVGENTPADSIFATTDRPNMPVATLAGRTIILGYRGWLFNFSIPYADREAAVSAALAGNFADPALKKFKANYVLVGTNEDPSWQINRQSLAAHPSVYQNNSWALYQVQ